MHIDQVKDIPSTSKRPKNRCRNSSNINFMSDRPTSFTNNNKILQTIINTGLSVSVKQEYSVKSSVSSSLVLANPLLY